MEKLKIKPHDDFLGTLFTIEEFIEDCEFGGLTDYDGFGYLAKATFQTNTVILPSEAMSKGFKTSYTHVMWYNK